MQNSVFRGREKEHEGEDIYGSFVPAPSVGNVLRVAPYTAGTFTLNPAVRGKSDLVPFTAPFRQSANTFRMGF
jgi:hypothetical protein